MTIVQLEYLLAVANNGSFSAAAEACFVTQPSLSMQIKSLEEELGAILLDRTKKPVMPTEIGRVVIEYAREAVAAFNKVSESVNEFNGDVAGLLRVGIIPTLAPYLTQLFLPQFMAEYPDVELEIAEMQAAEIKSALDHDKLDVAIMSAGTCDITGTETPLFDDRFMVYVSPTNDLSERTSIRIEDINVRELILLCKGHCFRDQVLEMFHNDNNRYSKLLEGDSIASLMRVVDTTNSVTIIPQIASLGLADEHRGQLKPLSKAAFSRKIVMITRRTYVKHLLTEALKNTLLEAAAKLA